MAGWSHLLRCRTIVIVIAGLLFAAVAGCESEIRPPDEPATGTIQGRVEYVNTWPPRTEVRDLRFVALPFVPRDSTDILRINDLIASETLTYGVDSESFVVSVVPAGTYPFSGIARQRTEDLLSWEALGLYTADEGVFEVREDQVTDLVITVDFDRRPDVPWGR
jgi:hypothetical protein